MFTNRANTTLIWACTDCTLAYANGEYSPDRPTDLPEPLCLVDKPHRVTMGMLAEKHAEGCPNRVRGDLPMASDIECDCESDTFSTSACDLCGDFHHGERHAFTWWHDDETAEV